MCIFHLVVIYHPNAIYSTFHVYRTLQYDREESDEWRLVPLKSVRMRVRMPSG